MTRKPQKTSSTPMSQQKNQDSVWRKKIRPKHGEDAGDGGDRRALAEASWPSG